ncbi:FAD-dependent oxidoreductase [Candidatus Sumerlaeota bacterium]|nr:FAD-dependent oxidoreductase [Candidatus Sumerlaeota bacterium]
MNLESNQNKSNGNSKEMCGAVLVCGAGVAGIQASLDLSASGFRVYLIEEKPAVGGGMARLDKTFPTGDCATCIISPKLVECMRDMNIDVFTMSDVVKLDGEAGNFTATVRQRPRFVDVAKCTACGECTSVCPVELSSPFDAGIGTRKAIDRFYAQAAPNANLICKTGRATCSSGCPIDSSVQAYVALIAAGRFEEAVEVIRRDNPLPSICGRVCFHPCELKCNRGEIDEPINIRGLKRFAMDQFPTADPPKDIQPSGKSVAIVGSGPAGLAAAHSLALAGHQATVFESLPVLGGMLAVGIPDYRLPADILARDIDSIRALGVEFKTNAGVGANVPVAELENNFDAMFISTGAHESLKLNIPGEECTGVVHGVDFLRKHSLGEATGIGQRVVVAGGGNTAVDAARTALRVGAKEVTMLYRRTRAEMPADPVEIEATLEEGIDIQYLAAPVKVIAENGRMTGVECIRMKLGEPDASGRRRPVPIEGSEFRIEADTLIPAVSQAADKRMAEALGLGLSKWGTIEADALTMATSKQGVFAGGDVVAGPSSVIDAIAHGKRAAKAIDNYLAGRALDEGVKKPADRPNPLSEKDLARLKDIRKRRGRNPRIAADELDAAQRTGDFAEVEKAYTAEQARAEAGRCLNCAGCSECMLCVKACKAGAINHEEREKTFELKIGAVLLTPGFEAFDATRRGEFGYGIAPNVVTNVQFERILSASGPTGGHIVRPSDGKTPKRLAFIQCVGSRDAGCDNDYCSSICCMATTKEAILAKEHEPDLEITVFYLDLRAYGKDFDRYCDRAMNKMGVRYVRSFISRTYEMPGTRNLQLTYVDPDTMQRIDEEFDMIVLALGMEPSAGLQEHAQRMSVELNKWGFAATAELSPLETSRPGVYVGGAFQEPKDIPDTVMQASAAAAKAMTLLAPARGSMVRTKDYPAARDVTDEPPRIGVFVCHCGSNIASVVDIERVVQAARELPNVVYAGHAVYTCSDDSQDEIKAKIIEHGFNRVVIASCTPRTHEPIFRDTLRDAGLNPYLLEMANIRDQCSWVHSGNPEGATNKACDLMRMTAGRAANLVALKDSTIAVKNAALIVGGGVAGMTAALALADQGFTVHLVEKSDELGGTALSVHKALDGGDVRACIEDLITRVQDNPRVFVYRSSKASEINGHIGDFNSCIVSYKSGDGAPKPVKIEHGVVVVATGATEHKPTSYGYGQSDKVLTQLELSEHLAKDDLELPASATIAMIQCVEQRNEERPYCSRVCCTTAVKNALLLKERYPQARIVVLYRDMRTYGFREAKYREAREKGVLFMRYDEKRPPEVRVNGALSLSVHEPSLKREMQLKPDLLVLAAPMVPRADREELSELLRVPLNADGFFLEAHVKLRPVDFASEGLFLCGTAHAPKSISETISQANAVAGRAASILSKRQMPVSAQTAWVDQDKCISCMTCVHVCAYMAPRPNEFNKAEIQSAVCMGCGSCVADCPAKAIQLRNYIDAQILGAVDNLLRPGTKHQELKLEFLEEVGVAQPRWHKG